MDITALDWRLEVGSEAHFACKPGFAYGYGDPKIVCSPERKWISTKHATIFVPFSCTKMEKYCPQIPMVNG
jgi:hypothetical protein